MRLPCSSSVVVGVVALAFVFVTTPLLATNIDLSLGQPEYFECGDVGIPGLVLTDGDPVVDIRWDWGDGSTSSSAFMAFHRYANAGTYVVTATAMTELGASTSAQTTVAIVNAGLGDCGSIVLRSYPPEARPCGDVRVVATTYAHVGVIDSVTWSWGDGTVSDAPSPAGHRYLTNGTYDISVKVVTSDGEARTAQVGEIVIGTAGVDPCDQTVELNLISPGMGACGEVTVNGSTHALLGYVRALGWDWGDGSLTSSFFPARHTYGENGQYRISVTAESTIGHHLTREVEVFVDNAAIEPCPGEIELTLFEPEQFPCGYASFNGVVTSTGSPVVSLSWDFGDGATAESGFPGRHRYEDDGLFPVDVEARTAGGLTRREGTFINVMGAGLPECAAADGTVTVTAFPNAILQAVGVGGSRTSYTLVNTGEESADVTLEREGDFFVQSPTAFTLDVGEARDIVIEGLPRDEGYYSGLSIPKGPAVQSGLAVPVVLYSGLPPPLTGSAEPTERIVAVSGPTGVDPSGLVSFRNHGSTSMVGVLLTDVPWIRPPKDLLRIEPGQVGTAEFRIDRSLRSDAVSLSGSQSGRLRFVYFTSGPGTARMASDGTTGVSLVEIVDTVTPASEQVAMPPLAPGETALFMPGVGHVRGSVGTFVSNVTISGRSVATVPRLDLYYLDIEGGSRRVGFEDFPAGKSLFYADIVKSAFSRQDTVGTLVVRSENWSDLAFDGTVFNVDHPMGTYGTVLPAFRSDRGAGTGGHLCLTGLRSSESTHTNLYVQELRGSPVTVDVSFAGEHGEVIAESTIDVGAFALVQLQNAAPPGAVAAWLRPRSEGTGAIAAFATPVDRASGDTWAVSDWANVYSYEAFENLVVPVAGRVDGANDTHFRTSLTMTNTGATTARGRLRYHQNDGRVYQSDYELEPRESSTWEDVITEAFSVAGERSIGYVRVLQDEGSLAVTSRTYTIDESRVPAPTFGTAIPPVSASRVRSLHEKAVIVGIDDAPLDVVRAGMPATYRTNLGLLEVLGQPVRLRVGLIGPDGMVFGPLAHKEFVLGPYEFRQLQGIVNEVLGDLRDKRADLEHVNIEVIVVEGDGGVIAFATTLDNGTGDSVFRME